MMTFNIWWIGTLAYRNPLKSMIVLSAMLSSIRKRLSGKMLIRAFNANGKYVLHAFHPSWPSKAFNSFFESRLHEIEPISHNHSALRRLFVAITKRCPLHCQHCSEADTLYADDRLSYEELEEKIELFVGKGVSQLVYTGGEPLSRFNDLKKLISTFRKKCDQWVYTSGYGLTLAKSRALKEAGLNGVAISLDHHLQKEHNHFRDSRDSYEWVLEAVNNCHTMGIFTALNICPTKTYISSNGFEDYIKFAKKLNVPVINIIEPRSVGNYRGKGAELEEEHQEVLLRMASKYNFTKSLIDFPTVVYPAAFGKSLPCGGGRSYLFLDFDGKLYPCPFCKVPMTDMNAKDSVCAFD